MERAEVPQVVDKLEPVFRIAFPGEFKVEKPDFELARRGEKNPARNRTVMDHAYGIKAERDL